MIGFKRNHGKLEKRKEIAVLANQRAAEAENGFKYMSTDLVKSKRTIWVKQENPLGQFIGSAQADLMH